MAHFGSRREFLAGMAALGAEAVAMQSPGPSGIPMRPLGKTGDRVTIVGLGGWDAAVNKDEAYCVSLIQEAIDLGITLMDNAWEYHRGRAEEVMGKALSASSRRDKVFLMTKTCARDYQGFQQQFDEQLKRLQTDRVELLQFHSIQYPGDRDRIFDPERGALKAALEAQKAGKIRHLGFTGHMDPKEHLNMLAAPFPWATVQMPLNILDAHYLSFQTAVLPECRTRQIGVLGMKSLGAQNGRIPKDAQVDWKLCRRYALSLPVSSVICGLQTREEVRSLAELARTFKPLNNNDIRTLLSKTQSPAADGHIELYKDRKSGYGCSHHSAVLRSEGKPLFV